MYYGKECSRSASSCDTDVPRVRKVAKCSSLEHTPLTAEGFKSHLNGSGDYLPSHNGEPVSSEDDEWWEKIQDVTKDKVLLNFSELSQREEICFPSHGPFLNHIVERLDSSDDCFPQQESEAYCNEFTALRERYENFTSNKAMKKSIFIGNRNLKLSQTPETCCLENKLMEIRKTIEISEITEEDSLRLLEAILRTDMLDERQNKPLEKPESPWVKSILKKGINDKNTDNNGKKVRFNLKNIDDKIYSTVHDFANGKPTNCNEILKQSNRCTAEKENILSFTDTSDAEERKFNDFISTKRFFEEPTKLMKTDNSTEPENFEKFVKEEQQSSDNLFQSCSGENSRQSFASESKTQKLCLKDNITLGDHSRDVKITLSPEKLEVDKKHSTIEHLMSIIDKVGNNENRELQEYLKMLLLAIVLKEKDNTHQLDIKLLNRILGEIANSSHDFQNSSTLCSICSNAEASENTDENSYNLIKINEDQQPKDYETSASSSSTSVTSISSIPSYNKVLQNSEFLERKTTFKISFENDSASEKTNLKTEIDRLTSLVEVLLGKINKLENHCSERKTSDKSTSDNLEYPSSTALQKVQSINEKMDFKQEGNIYNTNITKSQNENITGIVLNFGKDERPSTERSGIAKYCQRGENMYIRLLNEKDKQICNTDTASKINLFLENKPNNVMGEENNQQNVISRLKFEDVLNKIKKEIITVKLTSPSLYERRKTEEKRNTGNPLKDMAQSVQRTFTNFSRYVQKFIPFRSWKNFQQEMSKERKLLTETENSKTKHTDQEEVKHNKCEEKDAKKLVCEEEIKKYFNLYKYNKKISMGKNVDKNILSNDKLQVIQKFNQNKKIGSKKIKEGKKNQNIQKVISKASSGCRFHNETWPHIRRTKYRNGVIHFGPLQHMPEPKNSLADIFKNVKVHKSRSEVVNQYDKITYMSSGEKIMSCSKNNVHMSHSESLKI